MRRFTILLTALLVSPLVLYFATSETTPFPTSAEAQAQQPINNSNVPRLPFEVAPDFLKYPATMNLGEVGRRPEGYDSGEMERPTPAEARPADGLFNGPTDIAWDASDNILRSIQSQVGSTR